MLWFVPVCRRPVSWYLQDDDDDCTGRLWEVHLHCTDERVRNYFGEESTTNFKRGNMQGVVAG